MTDPKDPAANPGKPARRNSYWTIARMWALYWTMWFIGQLLDLLWLPGFIRAQHHESIFGPVVDVHRSCTRTIINVNGLHIVISRITGEILGVGYQPAADLKKAGVTRPIPMREPPPDQNP